MEKKVIVFLADGFEEIEGLTVVDMLRRAGINVVCASITGDLVIHGAHGIDVLADTLIEETIISDADMLVLPGGMPGTIHLGEHKGVCEAVCDFAKAGKWIAAICAAPTVFGNLGLLKDKEATCYPSMKEELICKEYKENAVVVADNIITSRGMGTALDFSLKMIEVLINEETAEKLAKAIVYK